MENKENSEKENKLNDERKHVLIRDLIEKCEHYPDDLASYLLTLDNNIEGLKEKVKWVNDTYETLEQYMGYIQKLPKYLKYLDTVCPSLEYTKDYLENGSDIELKELIESVNLHRWFMELRDNTFQFSLTVRRKLYSQLNIINCLMEIKGNMKRDIVKSVKILTESLISKNANYGSLLSIEKGFKEILGDEVKENNKKEMDLTSRVIDYLYNNGYLIIDNEKTHQENMEIITSNIDIILKEGRDEYKAYPKGFFQYLSNVLKIDHVGLVGEGLEKLIFDFIDENDFKSTSHHTDSQVIEVISEFINSRAKSN